MFHQLLESGAPTPRRGGWTLASGVVHAAVIGAAAWLTMPEAVAKRVVDYVDLVYMTPTVPAPSQVERSAASEASFAPRHVLPDLRRIDFPTIPPVGIPEPSTRLSDPATDFGGGSAIGPVAPGSPVGNQVYSQHLVERAVLPRRDNPSPDFPNAMRSAGVEGSVLVQFVVDTTGRVEANSISILRETHAQFGDAVRRWLGRTRYLPAEIGNTRVRQLVQQEVGFTLKP